MKTQTKKQLIEMIEKKGALRPKELSDCLKISPQALHRHLNQLVDEGKLIRISSPPYTKYNVILRPDFSEAQAWYQEKRLEKNPDIVSETRDIFKARLDKLISFDKSQNYKDKLPLIISTTGEIGNNCYDHNLGKWQDVPGCWFEYQKQGKQLWLVLADRGQGILHSLSRVVANLNSASEALKIAYEQRVSGRSPEKRGNGLKFVRGIIEKNNNTGLACYSSGATICYGGKGQDCLRIIKNMRSKQEGTFVILCWGLDEN